MKWHVTLKQLRKAGACYDGYNKVVCMLSGKVFAPERETYMRFKHDGYISLIDIAENNGIDDALWATRCLSGVDRDLRLYAVWCARQVQHLRTDKRSLDALNVAERYANGEATDDELDYASSAAWYAARYAARYAASDAARDAAWAAASSAARAAASDAAWDAARNAQKEMFIKMCKGEAPWQTEKESRE